MYDFDLDVHLWAVLEDEAGIEIKLPHSLLNRLTAMTEEKPMDENICILCGWEVTPDEPCNCGVLGGYVAVPYHVANTDTPPELIK